MVLKDYCCFFDLGSVSKKPRQMGWMSIALLSQMFIRDNFSNCAAGLDNQILCAYLFLAHFNARHSPICTFYSSHRVFEKILDLSGSFLTQRLVHAVHCIHIYKTTTTTKTVLLISQMVQFHHSNLSLNVSRSLLLPNKCLHLFVFFLAFSLMCKNKFNIFYLFLFFPH